MFKRLCNPLQSRSFFLFGARSTGKSTLLRDLPQFSESGYVDLLDDEVLDAYAREPKRLELLAQKHEWIFIDEVQKASKLLNTVHKLIEGKKNRFALTGSSARKLKRGGANLLGGRANVYQLYPLTATELGNRFELATALKFGTLPELVALKSREEKREYLKSYYLTFIREEIQIEQIVRKLDPFRNFLHVAAQMSGKVLNVHKIAKDVGADDKTVVNYLQILQDTLVGYVIPGFHRSIRKSQQQPAKLYLFDLGVQNYLNDLIDTIPNPRTSHYGDLFENFIVLEMIRLNEYSRKDYHLSYYRTQSGVEVDLVLSKARKDVLIEIKSTTRIDFDEVKALARNTTGFGKSAKRYYLSQDTHSGIADGVHCMHWRDFLRTFF